MSFSVSWHTLLEELEDLPEGATLLTPLSHDRFRVTDVQEQRVVIEFLDRDIDATQPLQRDQFDTLYRRISEHDGEFDLERLPPDADPYPAVLSLHPRFEVDDNQGVIVEKEAATTTQVIDEDTDDEPAERTEPDFDVYADALLLIDALERHEVDTLEELDTDVLVNLYTLCSDVQRNADSLRKELADVLLTRLHHDRPVSGPFGSVQRTSRRTKSLTDEQEVLETLEAAGVDRQQITSVDRGKVDDALEITDVAESDVYEVSESEYVRKADVDEDSKETRLQGLKDQLAASDNDEAAQLREEVEELEDRIDQLTSFQTGTSYHNQSNPG
jgi:hypothetical protein